MSKETGITVDMDMDTTEAIQKIEEMNSILKETKQLLKEVNRLNSSFDLNNILKTNKETKLIFETKYILSPKDIINTNHMLEQKLGCECIVLPYGLKLNKAIGNEQKNKQEADYITQQIYEEGQIKKETTIQYK